MSESKEQQHTPTPWRLLNHGIKSMGGGVVYTGGGAHRKVHIEGVGDLECLVFDADDTAGNNKLAANARLILRAVNSHQALIDEVKELRRQLQHFAPLVFNKNVIPHLPGNLEEETKEWLKGMRTENVLALAEKET